MSVASTIVSQIRSLDPRALMAWGAKEFVNTGCGLRFRTGGMAKHKGYVQIDYNTATDLYDLKFTKVRGKTIKMIKSIDGVFVDQLVYNIDSVVQ